jgi:hypothetical protein
MHLDTSKRKRITAMLNSRIPLTITAPKGAADVAVRLLVERQKLESPAQWKIVEKSARSETVTTLVLQVSGAKPGDTVRVIGVVEVDGKRQHNSLFVKMLRPRGESGGAVSGEFHGAEDVEPPRRNSGSKKLVSRERRTSRKATTRGPHCRACDDEISEKEVAVLIGSARVHSRCFVCDRCRKKLHIDEFQPTKRVGLCADCSSGE